MLKLTYRGAVTNNNVQFGEYASDYYVYQGKPEFGLSRYYQSEVSCKEDANSTCTPIKLANAGDKMYWKIVRVNGYGSLRLIYNGVSPNPTNNDLASSSSIGRTPYNLDYNDPKYTGYTYDRDTNETDSFIKREVDTWYKNTLGSNSSYNSKVMSGRFCSDSSGYHYDEISIFQNVFASFDRLAQGMNGFTAPNRPTLKCPTTSESYGGRYRLKAGLITADELVLAGESFFVQGESYLNFKGNFNTDYGFGSMSPLAFIEGSGLIYGQSEHITNSSLIDDYVPIIRPVINVTTDNGFTSGDGTTSNPYIIS